MTMSSIMRCRNGLMGLVGCFIALLQSGIEAHASVPNIAEQKPATPAYTCTAPLPRQRFSPLLRVVRRLPNRGELSVPADVGGQASDKPQGRKPRGLRCAGGIRAAVYGGSSTGR